MISEEMLKAAFEESFRQDMEAFEEETKNIRFIPDNRFKRQMNRLFRERVGTKIIPHPEVDNTYERVRSSIVHLWFVLVARLKKR